MADADGMVIYHPKKTSETNSKFASENGCLEDEDVSFWDAIFSIANC